MCGGDSYAPQKAEQGRPSEGRGVPPEAWARSLSSYLTDHRSVEPRRAAEIARALSDVHAVTCMEDLWFIAQECGQELKDQPPRLKTLEVIKLRDFCRLTQQHAAPPPPPPPPAAGAGVPEPCTPDRRSPRTSSSVGGGSEQRGGREMRPEPAGAAGPGAAGPGAAGHGAASHGAAGPSATPQQRLAALREELAADVLGPEKHDAIFQELQRLDEAALVSEPCAPLTAEVAVKLAVRATSKAGPLAELLARADSQDAPSEAEQVTITNTDGASCIVQLEEGQLILYLSGCDVDYTRRHVQRVEFRDGNQHLRLVCKEQNWHVDLADGDRAQEQLDGLVRRAAAAAAGAPQQRRKASEFLKTLIRLVQGEFGSRWDAWRCGAAEGSHTLEPLRAVLVLLGHLARVRLARPNMLANVLDRSLDRPGAALPDEQEIRALAEMLSIASPSLVGAEGRIALSIQRLQQVVGDDRYSPSLRSLVLEAVRVHGAQQQQQQQQQ